MKQKQNFKSKSGGKTRQNSNQGGSFKEPKTVYSKSDGAKDQSRNPGYRVAHNPNENVWNRSRHSSVSDMWSDADEHFPALGASAAPGPKVNVWEERKSKQEEIKALEPLTQKDEEAMLQQALALSLLLANEEEERQKKVEEDYKMQLKALQYSPEDLDDFVAPDKFTAKNDSTFQDGFLSKEQHRYEHSFTNSTSNKNSEREKTYKAAGARPKVSKAIEAFGGWGLKDDKKRNNSGKISVFVDDVINENSLEESNGYSKTPNDHKNKCKNIKENCSEENSWSSADDKNCKKSLTEKSDGKGEFLYDERGSFLDDDGIWGPSNNETVDKPSVSSNEVLDPWLSSEDVDLNKEILNEKVLIVDDKKLNSFNTVSTFDDKPNIDDNAEGIASTSVEFSLPTAVSDSESKINKDSQILFQKPSESSKSIWLNETNYEEQKLPEDKNVYKYDACDLNTNNFTPFHEPTQVPTLTSSSLWSDTSSTNSSYFSSYSDNLSNKLESVKLCNGVDNEVFNVDSSSNDVDVPPIPPPQPPSAIATVNDCSAPTSVSANCDCEVEPPPIPEPQLVPSMPVPQFPALVSPILNPMFPALNPLLSPGLDPLMMRQMLILSNPYLANQLLLMEQYYRSLGMPVDLFSMTSPMPNVPGMMNPSLLQNAFANNMNGNVQQLQCEIQQLQSQIDATVESVNRNTVENLEQGSCEKSHIPSGLDSVLDFNNCAVSVENGNDDPWFKSYLSHDNASVIPPPKPPSDDVNCNNLMSVQQKSESNENAASSVHKFVHMADNLGVINSSNTIKESSFTAFDACISKTEATGWSDPEDDFNDDHDLKSRVLDDGWGDEISPPKPFRNPSLHEDKKKAVFRQPAKQPQISRYPRSFKYS